MRLLPNTNDSLLVRTAFDDEDAWIEASAAATASNEDGFRAYVEVIDDKVWEGAGWEDVRRAVMSTSSKAFVLFVVDRAALGSGFPILVVDIDEESRPPFRCMASKLYSVDNNLNIGNMGWEEFAEKTEGDGIFRGF
jgi:hypothetical protein